MKRIGKLAFYDCKSLINITLPNGETYIDEYAFMGCLGLKHVTIPKSVTSIGNGAFNGCINIKTICYESRSPINIYGTVFSSETYSSATLYVPTGKTSLYKSTIGWKIFENISEFKEAQAFNSKGQIITDDIEEITSLIMDDSYHSIGDINGDNKVNVADIVEYANMVTINLKISNSSSVDVAISPRIMFALKNNLINTWFGDKGSNITIKSGETKMICNVKITNGKQLEGLHFARESELSNCLGNVFLYDSSSNTNNILTEMIDPSTTFGDRKTYEIVLNSMSDLCPISIAEFLSANASDMLYCVQGIITSDSQGKSFYIKDYSGGMLVYRAEGFRNSNIKVGDVVTVLGKRGANKEAAPMVSGFCELLHAVTPVTIAKLLTMPDDKNTYYMVTGKISSLKGSNGKDNDYGNLYITDGTKELYIYGTYPGWGATGEARKYFIADNGLQVGDEITLIGYKNTYKELAELCQCVCFSFKKNY